MVTTQSKPTACVYEGCNTLLIWDETNRQMLDFPSRQKHNCQHWRNPKRDPEVRKEVTAQLLEEVTTTSIPPPPPPGQATLSGFPMENLDVKLLKLIEIGEITNKLLNAILTNVSSNIKMADDIHQIKVDTRKYALTFEKEIGDSEIPEPASINNDEDIFEQ